MKEVMWRPSLDRINSNGNYAPGNVHLVGQAANLMKFDLPIDLFYKLCERITERRLRRRYLTFAGVPRNGVRRFRSAAIGRYSPRAVVQPEARPPA